MKVCVSVSVYVQVFVKVCVCTVPIVFTHATRADMAHAFQKVKKNAIYYNKTQHANFLLIPLSKLQNSSSNCEK